MGERAVNKFTNDFRNNIFEIFMLFTKKFLKVLKSFFECFSDFWLRVK